MLDAVGALQCSVGNAVYSVQCHHDIITAPAGEICNIIVGKNSSVFPAVIGLRTCKQSVPLLAVNYGASNLVNSSIVLARCAYFRHGNIECKSSISSIDRQLAEFVFSFYMEDVGMTKKSSTYKKQIVYNENHMKILCLWTTDTRTYRTPVSDKCLLIHQF